MEHNDELLIRLRKNQNTLVVVGIGVIAFGIWSIIKGVLYTAFNLESLLGSTTELTLDRWIVELVFWGVLGIILAIDLALRLYVGLSAMSEGRGRKKHYVYIVLAILMALLSMISLVATMYSLAMHKSESVSDALVTIVVELTSGITLFEMAVSAVKVKRLNRILAQREG